VKNHWISARKKLLQTVKLSVNRSIGEPTSDLQKFNEIYQKEFLGKWQNSSAKELISKVSKAKLVFGADFHAYSQSQRTHLRILRSLPTTTEVILCLEIFASRDQEKIDLFLKGKMSEKQFLKKIKWQESWGFPWENYKPLLDLAKKRSFKVVGLNVLQNSRDRTAMEAREKHAAPLISKCVTAAPRSLIYVIYGDLHLAKNNLPAKVFGFRPELKNKTLKIYQDSEKLYFKVAKAGKENSVYVLKKKETDFCVLTSPPWVKWQSYLLYLEQRIDTNLDSEGDTVDFTEHLRDIAKIIAGDLGIKLKFTDLSVYAKKSESIWVALDRVLSRAESQTASQFVSTGRSFFIPKGGIFFLSQPTVNHAASLCGDYIQAKLSGRERPLWNMPTDFYALIWIETVSFFASKLLNHRRKSDTIEQLLMNSNDLVKEVLLLTLQENVENIRLVKEGARSKRRFRPRRKSSYFQSARLLGGILGERLYADYRSGGIHANMIVGWLAIDVDSADFLEFYRSVVKKLSAVPVWLEKEVSSRL